MAEKQSWDWHTSLKEIPVGEWTPACRLDELGHAAL